MRQRSLNKRPGSEQQVRGVARTADEARHRGSVPASVGRDARTWRVAGAAALAATLLAATGCGGSEEAAAPPTFQAMTISTAATYYLAAVCPANQVFDDVEALTSDWEGQTTPLTSADAATLRDSADALNDGVRLLNEPPAVWPTEVQVGVVQVADEMSTVADSYQQMAAAPSRDAAAAQAYTGGNTAGGEAQLVRERLGLPPDNADDNGCG